MKEFVFQKNCDITVFDMIKRINDFFLVFDVIDINLNLINM